MRGLRAVSDFEAELQMAHTNRRLQPGVDTVFLMSALEFGYLSSTLAKEVAQFGGDVGEMVPAPVGRALDGASERLTGTGVTPDRNAAMGGTIIAPFTEGPATDIIFLVERLEALAASARSCPSRTTSCSTRRPSSS